MKLWQRLLAIPIFVLVFSAMTYAIVMYVGWIVQFTFPVYMVMCFAPIGLLFGVMFCVTVTKEKP
jgi:hypothetical protein